MDAECRRLAPPVLIGALLCLTTALPTDAQIRVNPTGVNVNVQGATSVFLTFGGIDGFDAVEGTWCGELVPAAPDIGVRCAPGTIFGQLPVRLNLSRSSGTGALTDIMTIPPSVSRRAYQAAESGANSAFYYVRRFRDRSGGPDQFVAVTCRLTGGGARTPLSITDVRVGFQADVPVMQVVAGERVPALDARISYNGTGRLAGRWEIVLPGEALPDASDLLTEASLPREQRTQQRRYTQLSRFNVFLPPTGSVVLPGPDPRRLPSAVDGVYHLLLRIEATPDKEGDSNLGAIGAGDGVVASGAVAGFPMPMLRYVVGSGTVPPEVAESELRPLAPLQPRPDDSVGSDRPLMFSWRPEREAVLYRLDVEREADGVAVGALITDGLTRYVAPPWFREQLGAGVMRWRVTAVDGRGRQIGRSPWWLFTLGEAP